MKRLLHKGFGAPRIRLDCLNTQFRTGNDSTQVLKLNNKSFILPVRSLLQNTADAAAKLCFCICTITFSQNSIAEIESENHPDMMELSIMQISMQTDSLLGYAGSASEGLIDQEQIRYRPMMRPGEILETVPGLITSQHSGEGKASQYFLRGFNLDHGTDFLTRIEGVPINMNSHAHGQGWTDIGFLIPELIDSISYKKGNYYAENGDFSSTGSADIKYLNTLPKPMLKFTGGSYDYYRGLVIASHEFGNGNLLYAGESLHNDGPWKIGNDFLKFNGVLRYSQDSGSTHWDLTAMAFQAEWNATDQIPKRAVDLGLIDRFDTIDSTDGGESRRFSLTSHWHRLTDQGETELTAYGVYNHLDLFSNFTYFLENPALGDQFAQPDRRWTTGLKANHTLFHQIENMDSETTIGFQFRNDNIENALLRTTSRRIFASVREDEIWVTGFGVYMDNNTRWNDWLRTQIGVRYDAMGFNVTRSSVQGNTGTRWDGLVSPKASIVLGPWNETEFYLNGGLGFHSNDARGVNSRTDPETGQEILSADPLVRTYGAETGIRTSWFSGLQSTLSVWWLDLDSELQFIGDAGRTEASRPSRRYGIEWANFYTPVDWLTFDANFSYSKARFRDNAPLGNHIPGAMETVLSAGMTVKELYDGFYGSVRLRYFGPRPLTEDNEIRSKPTLLLSALIGYKMDEHWTVNAEFFNLLNRTDSAIDYYYRSRLPGENETGIEDVHFHPVEPFNFRLSLTVDF